MSNDFILRFAALAAVATPLFAQAPTVPAPTTLELLQLIEAQDRRIAELSKPAEQAASSTSLSAPQKGGLPLTATFDKGFRLKSSDPTSPFELKINGRMQFRVDGFDADKNAQVINSDHTNFEI